MTMSPYMLAVALTFPPQPEPVTQGENISVIRQDIALIKQDVAQLKIIAAENRMVINDLPKSFVPRSEHDLRDQRQNYAAQIAELKGELSALRSKQEADKNDLYKAVIAVLGAVGLGAGGAGWILKNQKVDDKKNGTKEATEGR